MPEDRVMKKHVRVLTADPSRFCGLAVIEDLSPKPVVLEALQLNLPRDATLIDRCLILKRAVWGLLMMHRPFTAAFVEHAEYQYQHQSNTETERALGAYAITIALTVKIFAEEIAMVEIDPTEWHNSMIGPGLTSELYKAASLAQVQLRFFQREVIDGVGRLTPFETKSDNVSDAVMIGGYGLGILRTGLEPYLAAREARRKAIKKRKQLARKAEQAQAVIYQQHFPQRRIR